MLLTIKEAEKIREAIKRGEKTISLSPDLGLTEKTFSVEELKKIPLDKIKPNFIYLWDEKNQELFKLAIFDEHYYKLEMGKVPYLVIDGFRMHLQNQSPIEYAKRVVKKLKPKGSVLDCFMGLGYVAIELAKVKEVEKVITIEKAKPVIELAKINPYSRELFTNKKIEIINSDCYEFLFKTSQIFDYMVVDPPSFRYKESRHFYSRKFLNLILSHLKPKGAFYFYTGRIAKEIMEKYFIEKNLSYSWDQKLLGFFVKRLGE